MVGPVSDAVTVVDDTRPTLDGNYAINAAVSGLPGDELAGAGDYVYIAFNEPVSETDAENIANYGIDNTGGGTATTISSAVYFGRTTITGVFTNLYVVRLTVTNGSIDGGDVLTITNNTFHDLAGNPIDVNVDQLTF